MPIQFACPHCGKQTTVADQYAGQSGPCAACNKLVTVPFAGTPAYPGAAAGSGGGAGTAMLVVGVVLLVGILACGGVIALIAIPGIGYARTSARRQASQNNLKQIGIAIHTYHDQYQALPPAVVNDASGKPLYSGFVLLLPYLEQNQIYEQFDRSKAWDDPVNRDLSNRMMPIFMNPASDNPNMSRSDYMLVGGPNAMLSEGSKITNVLDGTSNTIMGVEIGGSVRLESWAQPIAWDPSKPFDSPDPQTVNVLMGDGSVRSLSKTTPAQILRLLSDRQDGTPVNIPQ